MRRTLIRNIHHVVAVQNRAHRTRQKGTQNKSKSKNTQQLRKGGHTSSKALAPLPLDPYSRIAAEGRYVCVVCVYSYSIKLFTSRGKAAQNLSICSIHPALNSERKEKDTGYRTCHASAASGVISAKIRTSVHPPRYADQGHEMCIRDSHRGMLHVPAGGAAAGTQRGMLLPASTGRRR